jgi:hypothetical protein
MHAVSFFLCMLNIPLPNIFIYFFILITFDEEYIRSNCSSSCLFNTLSSCPSQSKYFPHNPVLKWYGSIVAIRRSNRGLIPGRNRCCLLFSTASKFSLLSAGYWALISWSKAAGQWRCYSLPSSVKDEESLEFTSTRKPRAVFPYIHIIPLSSNTLPLYSSLAVTRQITDSPRFVKCV